MSREIEVWQAVLNDESLLEKAAEVDPSDVSAVARLRRDYPAKAVSVALELSRARAKAAEKFGERGRSVVADVQGVEQASGAGPGAYKARRIRESIEGGAVADLCCGIGGDSMAMCEAGIGVVAVDREELRAWMASVNTGGKASTLCADVCDLALRGMAVHIDPARRDENAGRRAWRLSDYQPGPEVVGRLIEQSSAAAVKLSPGIDLDELPWRGEVQFISEHGRLVQAVLWTGAFARASRSATLIDAAGRHTISGDASEPTIGQALRYLYAIDPAVERAQLIGPLAASCDAPAIHPRLGLLTSDRMIASPWLTGFELIERLPWRPKRVKAWLAGNDGGLVEVKTRGKACDPDTEQRNLRGGGTTTYTVFVLRFGTKVEALITRRL